MTRARLVALVSAAALCAESASAEVEVCRATCAPDDLACTAAVALCELQIEAFSAYMDRIDTGGPKYALPQTYQDLLRPHYPNVDLSQIRFAFSDQQPPENATTDCQHIYFNDASYVAALRDAAPVPKLKLSWLLHELAHPEQCAEAGGREGYAKRWWSELETAVRASGEGIYLFQTTEQLVKQLQDLYFRVHDSMPMEQAAEAKAKAVLADLELCCLTAEGDLVRPSAASSSPRSSSAAADASRRASAVRP